PDEHQELLHLTDLIEKSDAERMKHISDLSRIRGVSVEVLMEELGISPFPIQNRKEFGQDSDCRRFRRNVTRGW
ncbi:MAG: hypothetical protein GY749_44950, partial [Desulfobacteraceae bacterium]|nr:hypothetical protein [Desulfobacteraceae bacterium]